MRVEKTMFTSWLCNQALLLSSPAFSGTQSTPSFVHSFFFGPTDRPSIIRDGTMGNETIYWDGLKFSNCWLTGTQRLRRRSVFVASALVINKLIDDKGFSRIQDLTKTWSRIRDKFMGYRIWLLPRKPDPLVFEYSWEGTWMRNHDLSFQTQQTCLR